MARDSTAPVNCRRRTQRAARSHFGEVAPASPLDFPLSVDQAAQLLGVSVNTLRDWDKKFRRGAKLDPRVREFTARIIRVGRSVRIPSGAVEELLESRRNGRPQPSPADLRGTVAGQDQTEQLILLRKILDELRKQSAFFRQL